MSTASFRDIKITWKTCDTRTSLYISKSYLPGTEATVIMQAVLPGRGPSIALRLGWRLRLPQMWVTRVRNLLVWGSAFALTPVINNQLIIILLFFCLHFRPKNMTISAASCDQSLTGRNNQQQSDKGRYTIHFPFNLVSEVPCRN